MEGEMCIGN